MRLPSLIPAGVAMIAILGSSVISLADGRSFHSKPGYGLDVAGSASSKTERITPVLVVPPIPPTLIVPPDWGIYFEADTGDLAAMQQPTPTERQADLDR